MRDVHIRRWFVLLIAGVILTATSGASALDAAKDRRGLFWGMGLGGSGDISVPGSDAGGGFTFDLQLGAGATRQVTLSLDIDVTGIFLEQQQNIIFCPGPELNYYFGETGLFIRVGLAAALSVVRVSEENEFHGGFQAGAGFGWEFFANNSLAVGIAFEGDYMFRTANDFAMIGFMFNMKYY